MSNHPPDPGNLASSLNESTQEDSLRLDSVVDMEGFISYLIYKKKLTKKEKDVASNLLKKKSYSSVTASPSISVKISQTLNSIKRTGENTRIVVNEPAQVLNKKLGQLDAQSRESVASSLRSNRKSNTCHFNINKDKCQPILNNLEKCKVSFTHKKKMNPSIKLCYIPEWIPIEEVTKNLKAFDKNSNLLYKTNVKNQEYFACFSISAESLSFLPNYLLVDIIRIPIQININPQKCKTCSQFGHSTKNHKTTTSNTTATPAPTEFNNFFPALKKTIINTDLSYLSYKQLYNFTIHIHKHFFKTSPSLTQIEELANKIFPTSSLS